MADSKITALTALTAADPANDMIPIVDVSDTPPASGNTKRISINNILAASGTATLASATITGDLTVRTTGLVVNATGTGVQVSPSAPLCVKTRNSDQVGLRVLQSTGGTAGIQFTDDPVTADWGSILATSANLFVRSNSLLQLQTGGATERLAISSTGVCTWSNVGGFAGTAMTLNANGLGVGISPSYRLNIGAANPTGGNIAQFYNNATSSLNGAFCLITQFGVQDWYMGQPAGVSAFTIGTGTTSKTEFFRIDGGGNVGIGVTPSAWNSNYNALDIGQNGTISGRAGSSNTVDLASNGFRNTSGNWVYKLATSNTACRYQLDGSTGSHIWYSGAAGTAGNTIAGFSSALMTLDASGNLILQPPSSPPTLGTNGQLTVNATSNTNLRFSYRGSDGVTRVANITLA